MDNQHRKIHGYRELNQAEIDLMNEIKSFGPQLQALVSKVSDSIDSQFITALNDGDDDEVERLDTADAERWRDLAMDHLQQGLMCLTRAVAQPTTF
jgi:hypothetical protein